MSLARLALRLAAFEALCPSVLAASGPWPTIAGNLVYDSRIDLIEGDEKAIAELEGKPLAVVYTERDDQTPYGEGVKYPAQEQVIHLTVEIMIAAAAQVEYVNAAGATSSFGALAAPITDRQHEAMLDLLEAQVRRALGKRAYEDALPSSTLYNRVAMEIRHIESLPQRSADRATRIAARTIIFAVKVRTEKWPLNLGAGQTAPTGFALLPEPLATVANGLDSGSTGYALCQALVGAMPIPVSRVALTDIHGFFSIAPHAAPTQLDGSDSDVQADLDPQGS
jgi:hypothetical protein